MKRFDKNFLKFKEVLSRQLQEELVIKITEESRIEYEKLIPQIPYIGGDKVSVTKNLIDTTMGLALYKILKKHGFSTDEIAVFHFELVEEMFNSISLPRKILMRSLVGLMFSFPLRYYYKRKVRKLAAMSQRGEFPNLVLEYVEGNGKDFDVGIDYIQCPICKFWREQGAEDILPYICLYDFYSSNFLGTGLVRTTTLAEGFDRCDFRLKRGRKTQNKQKTQVLNREDLKRSKDVV